MAADAYGSEGSVRTILENSVRFSDGINIFGPAKNNRGTINLAYTSLTMNNAYKGKMRRFEFKFEDANDLTKFNVYKEIGVSGSKVMALLTTGDTDANLTIANTFIINKNGWVGAAQLNDVFVIETDSHRSNNDLTEMRNNVSAEIDDTLRSKSLIKDSDGNVPDEGAIPDDLYFNLYPPIPSAINIATNYLTAFYILDDVLRNDRGIKLSGSEELQNEDGVLAYRWQKKAIMSLKRYIEIASNADGNAPRYSGVAPLQQNIGIDGIAGGVRENEVDEDYSEETNDEFDTLYDDIT